MSAFLKKLRQHMLIILGICLVATLAFGQEGHPLDGTWSGYRIVNGEKVRVLVIMRLLPDQRIEGTIIENGARIPLRDVNLDPSAWTVSLTVDGPGRSGEQISYSMEGSIENLGSARNRIIVGQWRDEKEEGDFSLNMN